jgi:hypothetical protein
MPGSDLQPATPQGIAGYIVGTGATGSDWARPRASTAAKAPIPNRPESPPDAPTRGGGARSARDAPGTRSLRPRPAGLSDTYACGQCRQHVANHEDILSKAFQGRHGRAYLFNLVSGAPPPPLPRPGGPQAPREPRARPDPPPPPPRDPPQAWWRA